MDVISPAAQWSLVIIAIFNVLLFGGLCAAVIVGIQQFKKLREQVQPIIDRVPPIMERVPPIMEKVHTIMESVPPIMERVPPILDEAKPIVAKVTPMIDENVKPILTNVQEITHKVSGIVTDVGQHAHEIAETGEQTVKGITHRVEATSNMVTDNVSKPVISAVSLITGVGRAFSVLKNYKGDAPEEDSHDHVHSNGNGVGAAH